MRQSHTRRSTNGMTINFGLAEVSLLAAASVAVAVLAWLTRARERQPPTKWTEIGEVSSLCIYPLKSGKATLCNTLQCTESGVSTGSARDRMFLVIDSNGKVQSGREYPRMTQITADVNENRLKLSGPDCEKPAEVTLPPEGKLFRLRIWDATAEGIDCGDEIADWLTSYLKAHLPLRLLYRAEHVKQKDFNPGMKKFFRMMRKCARKSDAGLFSDTFSYHLVSESSVDDLNRRSENGEVTPYHFRPNIIVRGEKLLPFEEDRWRWVKIGDVVFEFLAPCMRCQFTTVDPETGKKSSEMEPLQTLRRYRFIRDEQIRKLVYTPTMGIYLGSRHNGAISVGDVISVPDGT